jgi:hypothetical protein
VLVRISLFPRFLLALGCLQHQSARRNKLKVFLSLIAPRLDPLIASGGYYGRARRGEEQRRAAAGCYWDVILISDFFCSKYIHVALLEACWDEDLIWHMADGIKKTGISVHLDDGRPKINGAPFDSKSLEMIVAAQMAEQQKQICRLFLSLPAVIVGHLWRWFPAISAPKMAAQASNIGRSCGQTDWWPMILLNRYGGQLHLATGRVTFIDSVWPEDN